MPHRPADHGIPTLTQRAGPTLPPSAPLPDVPLLTEVALDSESAYADATFPPSTAAAETGADAWSMPKATKPDPAPDAPSDSSHASILAARLQAEVEQAMRQALTDAIEQIQARMDETLPHIVARVLQNVRPG